MSTIRLPPPPPLGPTGFSSSEWQRWFLLLQQALTQSGVALQGAPASFTALAATAGLTVTGSETVSGNLTVTGKLGVNGKPAQAAFATGAALGAYAAGANGLSTGAAMSALVAKVQALDAALKANGIAV